MIRRQPFQSIIVAVNVTLLGLHDMQSQDEVGQNDMMAT